MWRMAIYIRHNSITKKMTFAIVSEMDILNQLVILVTTFENTEFWLERMNDNLTSFLLFS
jgi:hypothetical protein